MFADNKTLHERMSADVYATDSYQNVLFSVLKFRSLMKLCPSHLYIVTHDFKKRRFLELHLFAIRWEQTYTTFVGIDPPEEVTPKAILVAGERERGWGAWKMDLYGTGMDVGASRTLGLKRRARGWKGSSEVKEPPDSAGQYRISQSDEGTREVEEAYLTGPSKASGLTKVGISRKADDESISGLLRFRGLRGRCDERGHRVELQELYRDRLPWDKQQIQGAHEQSDQPLDDAALEIKSPDG